MLIAIAGGAGGASIFALAMCYLMRRWAKRSGQKATNTARNASFATVVDPCAASQPLPRTAPGSVRAFGSRSAAAAGEGTAMTVARVAWRLGQDTTGINLHERKSSSNELPLRPAEAREVCDL